MNAFFFHALQSFEPKCSFTAYFTDLIEDFFSVVLLFTPFLHNAIYSKPNNLRLVHMELYLSKRFCRECAVPLKGRRDQKFCSDQCRNQFNNRYYAQKLAQQRQINRILVQNQQILAHYLLVEKRRRVLEIDLRSKGYLFEYHTHTKQAKSGQQYIFCYDFGYLRISAEQVYIIQGSC